jgi:hypothetical protein
MHTSKHSSRILVLLGGLFDLGRAYLDGLEIRGQNETAGATWQDRRSWTSAKPVQKEQC